MSQNVYMPISHLSPKMKPFGRKVKSSDEETKMKKKPYSPVAFFVSMSLDVHRVAVVTYGEKKVLLNH